MIDLQAFRRITAAAVSIALAATAVAHAALVTRIGPDGGAVDWIAADGHKIYAGTGASAAQAPWGPRTLGGMGANLWISTDHGASWRAATPAEAVPFRLHRDQRVADPSNRRVFYRIRSGYSGSAFQVSVDGGRTFKTRSRPIRVYTDYVWVVALRTKPTTLLMNIVTNSSDPANVPTLLRSVDGGRSWTPSSGLGADAIFNFWLDPGRASRVFAIKETGQLVVSTTAGSTWRSTTAPRDVRGLAVSPHRNSRILVTTKSGVYRSLDSGATWKRTSRANLDQISWDPVVPGDVFAASPTGAGVSHDGGRTWTFSTNGIKAGSVADLQTAPGRVVVSSNLATKPTLVSSTDDGGTWTPIHFEDSAALQPGPAPFLLSPIDANRLVVVAPDGFAWSADGGTNWTPTGVPVTALGTSSTGEVYALGVHGRIAHANQIGYPFDFRGRATASQSGADLIVAGTTLYAWSRFNQVSRSRDGGRTWSSAAWIGAMFESASALTASPARPARLFAITEDEFPLLRSRLWRSDNGGTAWTPITPINLPLGAEWPVLAADPNNPDLLYAGSRWSGVWASTDAGIHWERITSLPRGVTTITPDVARPNRIWVGTDGYGIWRVDQ